MKRRATTPSAKIDPGHPPGDPDALHKFLDDALGVRVPRTPLLETSDTPFDYLCHAFFEGTRTPASRRAANVSAPVAAAGEEPPAQMPLTPPEVLALIDPVIWASRGGGKTFLGAVATLLDLIFKHGCEVRIVGGSLEQSGRMHEHLRRLCEIPAVASLVAGRSTAKRLVLTTGSRAEVLAQSETAVRGTRVQKLRCDEADLFDPAVWSAAQLTTRSLAKPGPWGDTVHGRVEALSTMTRPFGIMWDLVGQTAGGAATRRLFRWGVVDCLEHCPARLVCGSCVLEPECGGRAKERRAAQAGHLRIEDALAMKARVSAGVWESEMLCLRPRRDDAVIPEFDESVHVVRTDEVPARGAWVAGMDFGHRSPTVILWAHVDESGVLRVMHEQARSGVLMESHVDAILQGRWPRPAWIGVDPAGNATNDQTGVSNVNLLRRAGLVVRSRRSALMDGLALVRARLRPAAGPVRLFIHSRCTTLIESLRRYHFPPDRPESVEPVKDGHDHAVDALRYLVLNLDRPHRARADGYL